MTIDCWGLPSSAPTTAVRRYERAVGLMNAYQADPLAEIDAALAEQPDFALGHAFRAAILGLATDTAFAAEAGRSVAAAEALAPRADARERAHIAAARAWHDGDFAGATEVWGRIAIDHPRDIAAVQFAQLGDFYLGYSHMLRDRVARVLPHWSEAVPGYGFVLGMYAFGLEESGDYATAEEVGREAIARNAQDAWAAHAVAHVMEMQGRSEEGAAWLRDTAAGWSPNGLFAYHNWWHSALFALDRDDRAEALRLFDDKVAAGGFPQSLELIDGGALLWRLSTLGHDVGERWTPLAEKWLARIEDGYYAFNDLHAMLAFVGAGWRDAQQRLLAVMERSARGGGLNAMMTREVGLPAARAIAAFGRGKDGEAATLLLSVQGKANRFGGSHAQRDIIGWTLIEAALRGGDRALAKAVIAERLARKPDSVLNDHWRRRAEACVARSRAA